MISEADPNTLIVPSAVTSTFRLIVIGVGVRAESGSIKEISAEPNTKMELLIINIL
jgi:ABC-type enterobactin transport system permease subunit